MKLAAKFIAIFVVAVIGMTAAAAYFTSRQYYVGVKHQHQIIAKVLEQACDDAAFVQAMKQGDHLYLESKVRTQVHYETTVRWVCFGVAVPEELQSWNKNPPAKAKLTPNSKDQVLTGKAMDGDDAMFTYFQVKPVAGVDAVEIASSLEAGDDQLMYIWQWALISTIAMAFFSIAFGAVAGIRWIGRPLSQLTEAMHRIGQGDFSCELDLKTNDELEQLSNSVNQMCGQLKSQKAQIQAEAQERLKTAEQLRHADRLKTVGQLAAGFAHEIGTPLNVVAGRTSMILADPELTSKKLRENATVIKSETDRISTIVRKMLDFARRGEMPKAEADLRTVIQHVVDWVHPLALKVGVDIQMELPNLEAMVKFDFNQMQQVLINLLDNAVEASEEKGQPVVVSLEPSESGTHYRLSVLDHGAGMSDEERQQMFEPFYTTKEVGSGTGLGLSIVHNIIADHDGEIHVHSQPGQGTTVTVDLPKA